MNRVSFSVLVGDTSWYGRDSLVAQLREQLGMVLRRAGIELSGELVVGIFPVIVHLEAGNGPLCLQRKDGSARPLRAPNNYVLVADRRQVTCAVCLHRARTWNLRAPRPPNPQSV